MNIKITMNENISLYQKLAPKIRELKALGMTQDQIAQKLNVSIKTVRKSLNCI
jgi:orotate phosphoribosyltransferase-like protein